MQECPLRLCCDRKSLKNCFNCERRELFEEKMKTEAFFEHLEDKNNDDNNNEQ